MRLFSTSAAVDLLILFKEPRILAQMANKVWSRIIQSSSLLIREDKVLLNLPLTGGLSPVLDLLYSPLSWNSHQSGH